MADNVCYVPVSIGELIDKYTILQIKQNKIQNAEKLAMVEKEITYLQPFVDKHNLEGECRIKSDNKSSQNIHNKIFVNKGKDRFLEKKQILQS